MTGALATLEPATKLGVIESMVLMIMREADGSLIIGNNNRLSQGPLMRLIRENLIVADYTFATSERYTLTANGNIQADALLSAVK